MFVHGVHLHTDLERHLFIAEGSLSGIDLAWPAAEFSMLVDHTGAVVAEKYALYLVTLCLSPYLILKSCSRAGTTYQGLT